MGAAPSRNVELKARDPDPARTLRCCVELGAADHGMLEQRDTYFEVSAGRLKLREERDRGAHLVQYERDDQPQQRQSSYRIVPVQDAALLRSALEACLGVRAVVSKRRRLFIWESVRIHLDAVEGLGNFIELEAVAAPESNLAREHQLVAQLRSTLGITDDLLVPVGYVDVLTG